MSRSFANCSFCGKSIIYTDCSDEDTTPEDARCKKLEGWLSITRWKGIGSADEYDICSLDCLQKWVVNQLPKIPTEYLKTFEDDKEN